MSVEDQVPSTQAPSAGKVALAALKDAVGGLAGAVGGRAVDKVTGKVGAVTQRLTDYADGVSTPKAAAAAEAAATVAKGGSPVKAGVAAAVTGVKAKVADVKEKAGDTKDKVAEVAEKAAAAVRGRRGDTRDLKFTNFVEAIDIGAPVDVVYDAWTQYDGWPDFMKKVEKAELDPDEGTVKLKGQVFWSHREWETTITNQEPDRRVAWKSSGAKGHLSGTVTFHPLADDLTRMVLVVEYHPEGFMEKTGNIWRAVNRRLRLELKFFVRYVMTDVVLHPDDFEGYRAEIEDGEVVRTHDEVTDEQSSRDDADASDDASDGAPEETPEVTPEDQGESVEQGESEYAHDGQQLGQVPRQTA